MEHADDQWRFEGFRSSNFTSVPDEFFDVLAPRLSGGEVKVLLYIIRRTFGFKKERDCISISQMLNGITKKTGARLDHGAGLSKPSLCRALNSLAEKHVIIATRQFDFNGGFVATCYQLNMHGTNPTDDNRSDSATLGKKMRQGGLSQNLTKGMSQNLTKPLVKKRDIQDTVNNKQVDKNVNVAKKGERRRSLHGLQDRNQPIALTNLITEDILAALGDEHSEAFYRLVARKVPETIIRRRLSEVRQGGAVSAPKVFTTKIMEYAEEVLAFTQGADLAEERVALSARFKSR